MKYGITCHWSEDWQLPDFETDYVFDTIADALAAGFVAISTWKDDAPDNWCGFYIVSMGRDDSDEPLVFELVPYGTPTEHLATVVDRLLALDI